MSSVFDEIWWHLVAKGQKKGPGGPQMAKISTGMMATQGKVESAGKDLDHSREHIGVGGVQGGKWRVWLQMR